MPEYTGARLDDCKLKMLVKQPLVVKQILNISAAIIRQQAPAFFSWASARWIF